MVNGGGSMYWGTPTGAGTNNSGLEGQITYYASDGTTVSGTSTMFVTPAGNVGVGTTSPLARFTTYGNIFLDGAVRYINFGATSSLGDSPTRDRRATGDHRPGPAAPGAAGPARPRDRSADDRRGRRRGAGSRRHVLPDGGILGRRSSRGHWRAGCPGTDRLHERPPPERTQPIPV